MARLVHGYPNHTRRSGATVTKTYAGPDGAARQATEVRVLRSLRSQFPVPEVLAG